MKKPSMTSFVFPLLLVLAEMLAYLSTDMYLPALPQIAKALNTSSHWIQMTLTVWFIGSASLQLILGPLSDYFGRKPILLIGGGVFILSTLVCALTQQIHILLLARFIQGTTVSFIIVAGYASIHESLEQPKAIQTLAWMNSVSILAPALGPLIGGMILGFQSYHFIFWYLGISALLLFLLLGKFMPETNPHGKTKHPLELKKTLISYQRILSNSPFLNYLFIFCFIFGAFIAWITYSPFLLIESMGYSPFMYGCLQTLVFGSFIMGTRLIKRWMENYVLTRLISIGLSCSLLGGFSFIVFSLFTTTGWLTITLPLMVFAFGAGLISAPLNRLAIESSNEPMGQKVAIYSTMMGIFCIGGSLLSSYLYDGTPIALALIIGISALIAFTIHYKQRNLCQQKEKEQKYPKQQGTNT